MKKINFVITAFFILISSLLSAQTHNEEVTVEGKYTPQIQKSERLIKTPDIPKRDFSIPNYEINTEDFSYDYKAELEPISPLGYTSSNDLNLRKNFIKAGFGTRLSPDFLFRHHSSISKRTSPRLMQSGSDRLGRKSRHTFRYSKSGIIASNSIIISAS